MAGYRTFQSSFGGGEVTPEFYGRITDAKYQAGAATLRNFIVKPHGVIVNRPGFAYVSNVKDSSKFTRVIPFSYSTTQTFAIEMGEGYFRFHTQGATLLAGSPAAYNGATAYTLGNLVSDGGFNYYCIASTTGNAPPNALYWYQLPVNGFYEIPNSYAAADLATINFVQSADVLTLVHQNYPPAELRRYGATDWRMVPISFTPAMVAPTGVAAVDTKAASPTNLITYVYAVTSVDATGLDESIISSACTGVTASINAITNANPGVITTTAAHGMIVGQKVTITGVTGMTQINGTYLINTVPLTTTMTLKTLAGVVVDTSAYGVYTAGGTITPEGVVNNLLQTGASNKITWAASATASRYNVYSRMNGLYGYIGQTDGLEFKDDNITPDLSRAPPTLYQPFTGAGNYPGAVSYFEQRRCFAGSVNSPQTFWMTKSGTESNMCYSLPSKSTDAINITVAAREANTVRHIAPLGNLVLLTSSAEWRVSSSDGGALTPATISEKTQSYIGANTAAPLIVNSNMLYAAARGGHVRELAYSWEKSGFITGDLSLRAPHLFDTLSITDTAYAKAPYPVCWFVSSSGKLLGLTYVPEEQLGAWHQHETDGVFESICVVAEGEEDVLYAVIKRNILGVDTRFVERMSERAFVTLADSFFVDCGAKYSGVPTLTVSGLTWLENETVSVLADGAVLSPRLVSGGIVTLDVEASTVIVGLPYSSDLLTLPIVAQVDTSFGQGKTKNINKIWLRVFESSGIYAGPSFNKLTAFKQRVAEPYGSPPELATTEVELMLTPSWANSGQVAVRQSDPLPLTILSMTAEVAIGG